MLPATNGSKFDYTCVSVPRLAIHERERKEAQRERAKLRRSASVSEVFFAVSKHFEEIY